ncbi:MAG: hypothetical protein AAFX01_00395 [Cyanobacteria bacterium J06638_28]
MKTKQYLIAELPPTPETDETKELALCYTPKTKQGIFLHGDEQLHCTYIKRKTRIGNTGSFDSEDERPRSHQIPCSTWVETFGDPQIEAGQVHNTKSSGSRSGSSTDKTFSGFKFDTDAGIWQCHWKSEASWYVYNSSYYSTIEIMLELNLLDKVGQYIERIYDDMSD